MRTLKDFDFNNKRVLVRCDFNVPLDEQGNILDDFRIKQTIPTIEYLVKNKAKVILISHLGRPEGEIVDNLRLTPVQDKLKEYLPDGTDIIKLNDCMGEEVERRTKEMKPAEVLLLENLRFYKGEEENDEDFARQLAKLGDIYINDAFGVCHRAHASVVGVPKYLPSGVGLLLEKEIEILSRVLKNPLRPLMVIIGGAKIATKIGVIESFLEKADHLLLGGKIANALLGAKGIFLGKSPEELEVVKKIEGIELTNPKLHLPVDGVISLVDLKKGLKEGYLRKAGLGTVRKEEAVYDIGPETIRLFARIIRGREVSFWQGPLEYIKKAKAAKTVLWNGPLGYIENENFTDGSLVIADAIIKSKAFSIIGGGDTDAFLAEHGLRERFNHVSTGGGAMLEFLSGEKLPGIEVLS